MIKGGVASIYVSDFNRAVAFYRDVLCLEMRVRIDSDWAEFVAGPGLVIGLHMARPPETVAAGSQGAINVELHVSGTMEEAITTLSTRGCTIEGDVLNYEHVRIAIVRDPDGNAVTLAEVLS
ncbi:VOC family protein [Blastomonas sp.]|uniref:VOC family protein n=1 Tax=Blastomonas sp. TaxID=1909299 RepID=UPI003592EA3A